MPSQARPAIGTTRARRVIRISISVRAYRSNIAASLGRGEPIIAVNRDEAHPAGLAKASQLQRKCLKALQFQPAPANRAFLDSPQPKHYGPRGFKGDRNGLSLLATLCRKQGRSAWPKTRAREAGTRTGRPKRPNSPRGSSVSAKGSPSTGRAEKAKLVQALKLPGRARTLRRSPAASGSPPSWSLACWSAHSSAGRLTVGLELRRGG